MDSCLIFGLLSAAAGVLFGLGWARYRNRRGKFYTNERDEKLGAREAVAVRRQAIDEVLVQVNACIQAGNLPGSGWDEVATRNGMILLANVITDLRG